jgi:NAD(P)-dependent dehydrogenase (short-subunit alcohol dehydrogenase family)
MTIGLAQEVGPEGIRVNAVRPGLIATDMLLKSDDPERGPRLAPSLPIPRMGTPGEVARAILWLLSDEADYITGAILPVSGGRAILP